MSLFETGKDNIISEFKEHLAKHSQIVPAIAVLEALANDEGKLHLIKTSGKLEVNASFFFLISEEININHFSTDVKDNLMQIADWLVTHNEDDFMNVLTFNHIHTINEFCLSIIHFLGLCSFPRKCCAENSSWST